MRYFKQRHPKTLCECGNPKDVGAKACRRCNTLEARSAGTSDKTVGIHEVRTGFRDVAAACDAFLASRGLATHRWRSGWR